MTRTACHSAALDRIIAPWAARIAAFFSAIVETILWIAEIVRTNLYEFGALSPESQAAPGFAGRTVSPDDAEARDHGPSVSTLYALACELWLAVNRAGCRGKANGPGSLRIAIREASSKPIPT